MILKTAERKQLNAIAITDHNTIAGGIEVLRVCREIKSPVKVIVGAEILTNIGDIVTLFINEEIKSKDVLEVIDEVRGQGGLVVVPHPYKSHKLKDLWNIIDRVDMVEIANSRSPITKEKACFLETLNKTLVGSSDAHFPQEIGLSRTIIDSCDVMNAEQIKTILLNPSEVRAYGETGSRFFQYFSQIVKAVKTMTL